MDGCCEGAVEAARLLGLLSFVVLDPLSVRVLVADSEASNSSVLGAVG